MNTCICERRKEEWCFEQLWAKEGRMKKEEEEMRNMWEEENREREKQNDLDLDLVFLFIFNWGFLFYVMVLDWNSETYLGLLRNVFFIQARLKKLIINIKVIIISVWSGSDRFKINTRTEPNIPITTRNINPDNP